MFLYRSTQKEQNIFSFSWTFQDWNNHIYFSWFFHDHPDLDQKCCLIMNWKHTIENNRQPESRGAVFLTWSQNRCNPACVVQQNTAPKIHWANVPLHNTASVPLHYTIAKTQQVSWCCLNHRTTATKDTYHVTLNK